eukprot:gnl/TRDRNA2_/TRDRNA2_144986_c0_seq2.p1 gnl/TRDRNA2_/TRDRNA2_144986_c0~~gnl/TRDRNA2_/TRDRNA2_144986_c0_seq2.p1  ORF type:complete len:317 (+),score=49.84 gnl/TRDRNA2_/TRDRNA2_144986_c0_seq2:84-1034(+)
MAAREAASSGSTRDVVASIVCYTLCSSVMLVANKAAISFVPLPAGVVMLQIGATVVYILGCKAAALVKVDDLTPSRIRVFAPYVCSFCVSIYCNGKVLQYSNIETVITFRACSPLCVCALDWLFLGRELPSRNSLFALFCVAVGAFGYVLCDSEFALHGLGAYGWVSVYLCCNVFEMSYGKRIISKVEFESPVWGSVFYTNVLALGPMSLLFVASGELQKVADVKIGAAELRALMLACLIGIGISWSGWNCREKTSATTYTLIGVSCKLISVLLNILVWDKHATPGGIASLVVCLVASTLYRQAPLRKESVACKPE